ncbi:hypothetical protein, unlikely [Trypanosoma brucei gambiense DAL972]|uniref:Uncharacterized protein n=1 Tax=Trypanosoma brucei gambiense (strain MHOM/CI/86/DAL972) TaxID=679716 RepID=C9ZZV5_TRYB9|nr:hypothetical protein, unlikely [Trypanosoma brucei gambiense DAL972]CBH16513.1 hypothetical protein, unlikely [Trypanosoma brucei gambiense DAL972]|eukprot:XP_011778777.1 hypothetical protein, unlikely [Trypanosoma brucei gambiense DAL972]
MYRPTPLNACIDFHHAHAAIKSWFTNFSQYPSPQKCITKHTINATPATTAEGCQHRRIHLLTLLHCISPPLLLPFYSLAVTYDSVSHVVEGEDAGSKEKIK